MITRTPLRIAAIGLAALAPFAVQAHRAWMMPSATVVSGDNAWVTVDAAVSNDLFYFEHQPLRLDNLKVFAPDGTPVEAQNKSTGRYRSTFDVKLDKPGTWRISTIGDGAFASFKVNGETKRLRGTIDSLRKEIPAGATDLSVTRNQTRLDVFVTSGKPTNAVLKPTGSGLELVAYTHPNDLVAGDEASFGLTIDGKPAAGVPVTLIPGGIRYRNQLGEIHLVTGSDGKFKVNWPEPGMYWLNANYPARDGDDEGPARNAPQGGTLDAPVLRSSYTATLEVLAP
ncbi:MAG: DUF4198 domain-containing protein [Steroidobacteraceae bacterium]